MRFTPSEDFLVAARAAGRMITPKVYIKKTASRSELLSTGTWIHVTDYISTKDIAAIKSAVETNLSQFSADKLPLTGLGIDFWDTNYFNYANFLELKVEYILNDLVNEPAPLFAGWIEKKKDSFVVKRNERSNTAKFVVWSYIDYAEEIQASSLVTQYVDDDIDGAGADGLVLPHINGLFVTDANVTSFVLKKGVHTISYQVTDTPEQQAKLDDGDWVTLSAGANTLINGDADQEVIVYAKSTIPATGEFADDIIVNSPGDTFPKNWYSAVSARFMLMKLFEKAGITTLSFDTLECPTATGGKKVSFLERVVNEESSTTPRNAIASDGSYLWFGVGNKLYRRSLLTEQYTLRKTLSSGFIIRRILYNAEHGHLWILAASSSAVNFDNVYVYVLETDTITNPRSVIGTCSVQSAEIIDVPGDLKYALLYTDAGNNSVGEVTIDGSLLVRTTIYSGGGTYNVRNRCLYILDDNELFFVETNVSDVGFVHFMQVDGGGAWVDEGRLGGACVNLFGDDPAAYNPNDNRIYFYDPVFDVIRSYQPSTTDAGTVIVSGVLICNMMYTDGVSYVYASTFNTSAKKNYLYRINSGAAVDITDGDSAGSNLKIVFGALFFDGTTLWGVDSIGRLFRYDVKVSFFIDTLDCEGMNARAAIEKICSSFNLLYKVTATKSARVQRRSDENGDVVTSGNSVSLNSDNLGDVSDESFYGDAYDIVKMSNGKREVNYDGSVYDAVAFDEEKVFPIDSDWIPSEILEDLAFNLYLFFSVYHKVYLAPSPAALMQYECLDGATIVHTGNMVVDKTGVIVSGSIDKAGRPEFKVLANA